MLNFCVDSRLTRGTISVLLEQPLGTNSLVGGHPTGVKGCEGAPHPIKNHDAHTLDFRSLLAFLGEALVERTSGSGFVLGSWGDLTCYPCGRLAGQHCALHRVGTLMC